MSIHAYSLPERTISSSIFETPFHSVSIPDEKTIDVKIS